MRRHRLRGARSAQRGDRALRPSSSSSSCCLEVLLQLKDLLLEDFANLRAKADLLLKLRDACLCLRCLLALVVPVLRGSRRDGEENLPREGFALECSSLQVVLDGLVGLAALCLAVGVRALQVPQRALPRAQEVRTGVHFVRLCVPHAYRVNLVLLLLHLPIGLLKLTFLGGQLLHFAEVTLSLRGELLLHLSTVLL